MCPVAILMAVPRFSFYEKPMRSPYTIHQESAMGEQCKITTLTQEVIRRMRNTSREADQKERDSILTKFAVKMYRSGYREEKRREILVAGLKGYEKQLDMEDRGVRSLYRKQHEGKAGRARAKLNGRSDWFMKKP